MTLVVLPGLYAVARLPPDDALPAWAGGAFVSLTRTADELSVVCPDEVVPTEVRAERGFRLVRVAGTLDFAQVGVLAAIVTPLAAANVSVFAVSTFDTDYVLVKELALGRAMQAWRDNGVDIEGLESRL